MLSAVHVNAVVPHDDVVTEVADEQLHESSSVKQLIKEQQDDISLKGCFVLASVDKETSKFVNVYYIMLIMCWDR